MDSGFQVLDSSLSVKLRFHIPVAVQIPDSLSCIPNSKAQDFGFHKQKCPRFLIPLHEATLLLGFDQHFKNIFLLCLLLKVHLEKCPYAKVQCMHSGCGALVPRDDLPRHLTEDCSFRQVFCKLCKLETTADQLKVTFINVFN